MVYDIISIGENMKSISGFAKIEVVEKKSRFIGLIYHVETIDEVNQILIKARKDYPNANHYTYAYVLDDLQVKASDDGEPSRTAGFPILEVIKNNDLNYCLIIVIRYFGGILLGSGGLIRAYSHTASLALNEADLTKKITTCYCKVTCDYDNLGNIDKIIREETTLENVSYDLKITFFFFVNKDKLDDLRQKLFNHNNYQDNLEILEEKEMFVKTDY